MIEILSTFPSKIRYFDIPVLHFLPDTVLRKYMYMDFDYLFGRATYLWRILKLASTLCLSSITSTSTAFNLKINKYFWN